ncbi:MAG: GDP-L-fucose synthase [PVC group bacterium]|nr:GDP-L-fucose synthase [PVC group bacterium]
MPKNSRIYIAGHTGMVGRALGKVLKRKGYSQLIVRTSKEMDLRNQKKVDDFFKKEKPDYVFLFAAKVGGIKANIAAPSDFLYDNLVIETNVINSSYKQQVKKLLYLGSSCIYPRLCQQPMKEDYLLSGKLEPTNEGYALAKIVGLKLCEYYNQQFETNFIALMPPNLYGPHDNFDLESSHVVAALIRKFLEAKQGNLPFVEIWGSGNARREFLYVEDLADACFYFISKYNSKDFPSFINVGYGKDVNIKSLVGIIKKEIGYKGQIRWNPKMPDGMPRRLMDISQSKKMGWQPKTSLQDGIGKTLRWVLKNSWK